MFWTAKYTELLIAGFAGCIGSLLVMILWKWWSDRRAVKAELRRFGLRFEHTGSPRQLSALLVEAKAFLLSNGGLLESPEIKTFFDRWLTDVVLDVTGEHRRLNVMGSGDAVKELKADAAWAFLKERKG